MFLGAGSVALAVDELACDDCVARPSSVALLLVAGSAIVILNGLDYGDCVATSSSVALVLEAGRHGLQAVRFFVAELMLTWGNVRSGLEPTTARTSFRASQP